MRLAGCQSLLDVVSAGPAENNDIEERIGAETVGAVDGYTSRLASRIETRNNLVFAILMIQMINQKYTDAFIAKSVPHQL